MSINMESSTWPVPNQSVHSTTEDDFQQFLNMNGMGNLTDSMNYSFQDFQSSSGTQLLQSHPREPLDIPMSGADTPMLLSPAVSTMQHQMPALTSTAPFQSIPATMMPPPTPSEAIVDSIDAQIQFLQQQKLQHQQRQMEEQQAVFFARQQSRMVPPTPQSLDIQPGNNHYYGQPGAADQQQQQQHQQAIEYRYQRLKDQQDVSWSPDDCLIWPVADRFPRCPSLHWCHRLSPRWTPIFPSTHSLRYQGPTSAP